MDNSYFANIQKSLYNNILPTEILKAVCNKGLGGYMADLTQQRNEQIIAPLACAQDSARQHGSGAEHTSQTAKELLEEGKVSKKNNPNFCFMFHPFFGAKNGWSPRNSRAAVPFIQKVTQTCARQLGLYKLLSLIKLKCLLYLHSPQTNLACSCL